ncbi:MAG: hypothetical protein F4Y94_05540 [Chloroflexi bacterium]|nr:hypothetical protein [Chloroflexota bacterium]
MAESPADLVTRAALADLKRRLYRTLLVQIGLIIGTVRRVVATDSLTVKDRPVCSGAPFR